MEIRVAVHVHSNWSYDGNWSLSKISALFFKVRCHCVLTNEHDITFSPDRWEYYRKACAEASKGGTLIIPGIEYSDPTNTVHVLVWGDVPFLGARRRTLDILLEVDKFGGLAVLAHPSRRNAWKKYRHDWTPHLLGIELWNRKTDGLAPSREAISLIEQNVKLLPFVGLDLHKANQLFPLFMSLQINGSLRQRAVLEALRMGRATPKMAGIPTNYFSRGILNKAALKMESLRCYLRKRLKNG